MKELRMLVTPVLFIMTFGFATVSSAEDVIRDDKLYSTCRAKMSVPGSKDRINIRIVSRIFHYTKNPMGDGELRQRFYNDMVKKYGAQYAFENNVSLSCSALTLTANTWSMLVAERDKMINEEHQLALQESPGYQVIYEKDWTPK